MHPSFTRPETRLLLAVTALVLAAFIGPHVAQPAHAHDFADQRTLAGVPCALDVLSNIAFALAGAVGLFFLVRVPRSGTGTTERACAGLFFVGLLVTAAGSAWYHLAPHDLGLAIDRGAMGIAFAGLLALLAATRISDRAAVALAATLLVLAPASVWEWFRSGNVLPWALVQFGGMAILLLVLATSRPRPGALPVRWGMVLLAYAAAKLFEASDYLVYAASGELFSGHTIKHVVAACAAWPVIAAVAGRAGPQNERQTAAHAA